MGVWFGLEINLFRVVPLFLGDSTTRKAESTIKYFLLQAIGSVVVLSGALLNLTSFGARFVGRFIFMETARVLVMVGLIVKVGLVPFHFWVPRVMRGLGWGSCFVLSVWQKVGPVLILVSFIGGFLMQVLMVSGCLGRMVGGLGGFAQTQVRSLLGYSSIGHGGWLVVGGIFRFLGVVVYLLLYSIVRGFLFCLLSAVEARSYGRLSKGFRGMKAKYLWLLRLGFLTLAGLPPGVGFSMKWCVFWVVLSAGGFYTMVGLVSGSLLRLYYYMCIRFC